MTSTKSPDLWNGEWRSHVSLLSLDATSHERGTAPGFTCSSISQSMESSWHALKAALPSHRLDMNEDVAAEAILAACDTMASQYDVAKMRKVVPLMCTRLSTGMGSLDGSKDEFVPNCEAFMRHQLVNYQRTRYPGAQKHELKTLITMPYRHPELEVDDGIHRLMAALVHCSEDQNVAKARRSFASSWLHA